MPVVRTCSFESAQGTETDTTKYKTPSRTSSFMVTSKCHCFVDVYMSSDCFRVGRTARRRREEPRMNRGISL